MGKGAAFVGELRGVAPNRHSSKDDLATRLVQMEARLEDGLNVG